MILNLLRVEALRVEEMIKRSFSENSSQRLLPENQQKVIEVRKPLNSKSTRPFTSRTGREITRDNAEIGLRDLHSGHRLIL
jgi:superfamily II RNA helicase